MIEEFFLGFTLGLSGLAAFFHANLILQLSSPFLPQGFSKAVFSSALSFSKIVFELIPVLFFFVPSSSYGVSMLPAQRLFKQGKGFTALKAMLSCFFFSMLFSILLLPLALLSLPFLHSLSSPAIGWGLLCVVCFSLFSREKKGAALLAFALSGALGLVLFSKPFLREPLFPLLSGLFGIPAILFSLNSGTPAVQKEAGEVEVDLNLVFASVLFGGLSCLLPAMSPALVVSIVFILLRPLGESAFVQAAASVLVSKTFFDFVAFSAFGKARSGAVVFASQELHGAGLFAALLAGAAALFLAVAIVLLLYRKAPSFAPKGNAVHLSAFALILLGVFWVNGIAGVFALAVSVCVGVCAWLTGCDKTALLGSLILPSLLFYFGWIA